MLRGFTSIVVTAAFAAVGLQLSPATAVPTDPRIEVQQWVAHDTSPPLRDMPASNRSVTLDPHPPDVVLNRPIPPDRIEDILNSGVTGPPITPQAPLPGQ